MIEHEDRWTTMGEGLPTEPKSGKLSIRRSFDTIHKEERMTGKRIPVHLIFVSVYILAALVTLIPWSAASKTSLLGYKALCSFSPISTLVFLALAGLHIYLHSRKPAAKKTAGGTD